MTKMVSDCFLFTRACLKRPFEFSFSGDFKMVENFEICHKIKIVSDGSNFNFKN